MTLEMIDIEGFLGAVANFLGPILLVAIGGGVAFTLVRIGLKWARRSL